MDIFSFVLTPWFWLILVVLFSLIEFANSFNLVTVWFAIAALVMIFISGMTEMLDATFRFSLHLGIFLILSFGLLLFTRPLAIKKLRVGTAKTNVNDLVGRDALVLKEIKKFSKGEVKIKGQIWTAISEDDEDIEENSECVVTSVEGVKLIVRKKTHNDDKDVEN